MSCRCMRASAARISASVLMLSPGSVMILMSGWSRLFHLLDGQQGSVRIGPLQRTLRRRQELRVREEGAVGGVGAIDPELVGRRLQGDERLPREAEPNFEELSGCWRFHLVTLPFQAGRQ